MKKITLKDLAAMTGYSVSTVSRSLSDNERIPLETREKIKKVAREINFSVDINARNLSKRSSNTIGVFMQDDFFKSPSSTFTNVFWSTLHEEIQLKGYDPSLYLFKNSEDFKTKVLQLFSSGIIDGIVIFAKNISAEEVDFLEEKKLPYVLLYYAPDKYSEKVFTADNFNAGKIITEYLLKQGLNKIATVTSDATPSFKTRTAGYIAALESAGIRPDDKLVIKSIPSFQEGERIARILSEKLDHIDAVFVQHDIWALGMIKGFNDLGIKIPEQISVIGHDNLEFKSWFSPTLTTFTIETKEICARAIEHLIEEKILKNRTVPVKKILGRLVLGGSVYEYER